MEILCEVVVNGVTVEVDWSEEDVGLSGIGVSRLTGTEAR